MFEKMFGNGNGNGEGAKPKDGDNLSDVYKELPKDGGLDFRELLRQIKEVEKEGVEDEVDDSIKPELMAIVNARGERAMNLTVSILRQVIKEHEVEPFDKIVLAVSVKAVVQMIGYCAKEPADGLRMFQIIGDAMNDTGHKLIIKGVKDKLKKKGLGGLFGE